MPLNIARDEYKSSCKVIHHIPSPSGLCNSKLLFLAWFMINLSSYCKVIEDRTSEATGRRAHDFKKHFPFVNNGKSKICGRRLNNTIAEIIVLSQEIITNPAPAYSYNEILTEERAQSGGICNSSKKKVPLLFLYVCFSNV